MAMLNNQRVTQNSSQPFWCRATVYQATLIHVTVQSPMSAKYLGLYENR